MSAPHLRDLLARPEPLVMPFAYDAFSALLVAEAGFEAVGISGSGVSASLLGMPDIGVLTQTEVVQTARRICAVSRVPVLVDCDTGFGGVASAVRTVREVEAAEAAGLILEDQQLPKRCGHLAGISLIPVAEMEAKLRAVAASRAVRDTVLVGRTDALGAGLSLQEAAARANAWLRAGADVAFVSALRSVGDLRVLPGLVEGPLLVVLTEGGKTPFVPAAELGEWGYRIIGYAGTALAGAAGGALRALQYLRNHGTTEPIWGEVMPMPERNRILDLERYAALEDGA